MDLCLDDDAAAQSFGDGGRGGRVVDDLAARHRDPVAGQDLLGLVLVNLHPILPEERVGPTRHSAWRPNATQLNSSAPPLDFR